MREPLPGTHITYQEEYRKCGKVRCKTCSKSQGHGPYWYAYWSEKGHTVRRYIGKIKPVELIIKKDLETVETLLAAATPEFRDRVRHLLESSTC